MRIYPTDKAEAIVSHANRNAIKSETLVLVDGPGEGEASVMTISEAIAEDFLYRWIAR